jgi:protein SCO1/2
MIRHIGPHSVTPDKDSVSVMTAYGKRIIFSIVNGSLHWDKEEIYNLGRKFYFVEEDLGENNDSSIFYIQKISFN